MTIDAPTKRSSVPPAPMGPVKPSPKQSFDHVLSKQNKVQAPEPTPDEQPTDPVDEDAAAKTDDAPKSKKIKGSSKKDDAESAEPTAEEGEGTDETTNAVTSVPTLPTAGEDADAEGNAEADDAIVVAQKPDDEESTGFVCTLIAGAPQADVATDAAEEGAEPAEIAAVAGPTKSAEALKGEAVAESPVDATTETAGAFKVEPTKDTTDAQTNADGGDEAPAEFAKMLEKVATVIEPEADAEVPQLTPLAPTPTPAPTTSPVAGPVAPPEQKFVQQNAANIVQSVQTELLPSGGTMKLQMTPDHLGKLQIDVTVDNGVVTASFQTSNDEATRLLSHSLQQLKSSLETAGITVDKIQVKQAPAADASSSSQQQTGEEGRQQQGHDDHSARQEQQRKEALQRMWRKLAIGDDPLDLVA